MYEDEDEEDEEDFEISYRDADETELNIIANHLKLELYVCTHACARPLGACEGPRGNVYVWYSSEHYDALFPGI
jgi:hypothetical protein